jgi:hypothetical protein
MIPFFALLAHDHELPNIWLPINTIKLISIPPLIFDAPTQEEAKAMGDFVCSGCHRHPREKV